MDGLSGSKKEKMACRVAAFPLDLQFS